MGDTFVGFSGFAAAGVLTVGAVPRTSKSFAKRKFKGKGKPRPPSTSSVAVQPSETSAYKPAMVPSREDLVKVHTVALASADSVFQATQCLDPLPMLAAVMGVLSLSEESPMIPDADKEDTRGAIHYLTERLAAVQALTDPSAPSINLAEAFPRGESRRKPARTVMFDIARGLARRVPLTKLVALDGDVRPYLAALMVAALHRAKDTLVVPDDLRIQTVTREHFENMLAEQAGRTYDNYGMIAENLLGSDGKVDTAEVERRQRERMESQLQQVVYAIKELTAMQ